VQIDNGRYGYGIEIAIKNKTGVNYTSTPYYHNDGTYGVWLPAGGDPSYGGAPTNPNNTAIAIGANSTTWNKGIVFFNDGLTGSDGTTGKTAVAIEMAKGHGIQWLNPANGLGVLLRSDVATAGQGLQVVFGDRSMVTLSASGADQWFQVYGETENGGNGLRVLSRASGSSAVLESTSNTDSNVNMELRAKGVGSVDLAPGGAIQLRTSSNPSATDFWEFKGGTSAGGGVQCNAQGADTDVPIVFSAKGAGYFRFFTGGPFGAEQFRVNHIASAVNMLSVSGAASGNSPTLSATGAGADLDINLRPRGAGVLSFGAHTANADAAITGYITIKDASGTTRKLAVIA
jgi:hypothetical protein